MRRRRRTRRRAMTAKRVRNIVKHMAEIKHVDSTIASEVPVGLTSAIATEVLWDQLTQGLNDGQRIGMKVQCHNVYMKYSLISRVPATVTTTVLVRIMLVWWKDFISTLPPMGGAASSDAILSNAFPSDTLDILAAPKIPRTRHYRIMYDRTHQLGKVGDMTFNITDGTGTGTGTFDGGRTLQIRRSKMFRRCKYKIVFGNTTTDDVRQSRLCVYVVSTVEDVDLNLWIRGRYIDI